MAVVLVEWNIRNRRWCVKEGVVRFVSFARTLMSLTQFYGNKPSGCSLVAANADYPGGRVLASGEEPDSIESEEKRCTYASGPQGQALLNFALSAGLHMV